MTIEGLARTRTELVERINRAEKRPEEDKPKIRNRCGDCVAFHTPFCTWEESNPDRLLFGHAAILRGDVACCRFFPKLSRDARRTRKRFEDVVENL